MVTSADFRALVRADATSVRERQETDTIDVVDEIRHFVKTNNPEEGDVAAKMGLLDTMLAEMGYEV